VSHSPELIKQIYALVERDYPSSLFKFEFERPLPKTRMFPDIAVYDGKGRAVCAVEIGYTRPEKLTAYRKKHRIPDVRWYDKQGDLHADVETKHITLQTSFEPAGIFHLYSTTSACAVVSCDSCEEEFREELKGRAPSKEEFEKFLIDSDVLVVLITDYAQAIGSAFCDVCGEPWALDKVELCGLINGRAPRQLADEIGRRQFSGSFSEAFERLRARSEYEVSLDDLIFLDGDAQREINRVLVKALAAETAQSTAT
jgi:hypothetical protein